MLNKKIEKKLSENLALFRKVGLINIATKHCFDVTLAAFEWIINNEFIQLKSEWLNDVNYFSRESNKFGIIFA